MQKLQREPKKSAKDKHSTQGLGSVIVLGLLVACIVAYIVMRVSQG